jgi:sugar phosphate isomerase/epimerase
MSDGHLQQATWIADELRQRVPTIAKRDIDGVSVPVALLGGIDSASGFREVTALLSRFDLSAAAVRVTLPGRGLVAKADLDAIIDVVTKAMDVARKVGFDCVTCDLGSLPPAPKQAAKKVVATPLFGGLVLPSAGDVSKYGGESQDASTKPADPDHEAAAQDVLATVANRADSMSVRIAFGSSLSSPADLSHALEAVDCRWFGRDLDPANDLVAAETDVATYAAMPVPIFHVRGTDAVSASGRTRPVPPGEGEADWPTIETMLLETDFAGYVTRRP